MKHVFFLHSPITCIVAKAIMMDEKLSPSECLIVTQSNYYSKISLNDFSGIKVEVIDFAEFNKQTTNPILLEQYYHKWINTITGFNKFIFYTPHDLFFLTKYFVFNKFCQKYFYIEEGLGSFNPALLEPYRLCNKREEKLSRILPKKLSFVARFQHLDKKINIIRFLPTSSRYLTTNLFNRLPKYEGCYCISDDAFLFLKSRKQIDLDFLRKIPDNPQFLEAPFFVFDDMVNAKISKLETIKQVLSNFLTVHNIQKLNVKFHPSQKLEEKEEYIKILKDNNTQYIIIDDNFVLEKYFIGRDLHVYGFLSSLLFYNSNLSQNGKSYSFLSQIIALESNFDPNKYTFLYNLMSKKNVDFLSLS